ncbi:DUF4097 family beta strand repeat-containing protein [uncultured Nocardioides sp.]|uniref:DUF4097 family beta strand repeat-containing protein n=1 Tax=uncultured Nocardioides sp. TaxID=198441 RepID=UPI0026396D09|nr:DUF4097 family beta strand repeat-containing protein [uncultured Nocardioides sp.]
MPRFEFATPSPASVYVEIGRGEVRVRCAETPGTETTTVTVEGRDADRVDVHDRDGQVSVVAPRGGLLSAFDSPLDVTVTTPPRSNVATKLGSAGVSVTGPAGGVRLRTGSGEVSVESLDAPSSIDTGSGDVRVDRVGASLKVRTGSGDVTLREVLDELSVSSGSGDVHVTSADGAVLTKTGSGDLRVGATCADVAFTSGSGSLGVSSIRRGRISAKVASGDVRVGVPAGVPVWTDISSLTGRIHSTLAGAGQPEEGQDHVEVRAATVSGNVSLLQV